MTTCNYWIQSSNNKYTQLHLECHKKRIDLSMTQISLKNTRRMDMNREIKMDRKKNRVIKRTMKANSHNYKENREMFKGILDMRRWRYETRKKEQNIIKICT